MLKSFSSMDETRKSSNRSKPKPVKGGAQCIPRFRIGRPGSTATTPVSMLEKFREVVFRLVMLSALSKSSSSSSQQQQQQRGRPNAGKKTASLRAFRQDSYRSEAVEECIEFFKRSGTGASGDDAKSSTVSEDGVGLAGLPSALPVL